MKNKMINLAAIAALTAGLLILADKYCGVKEPSLAVILSSFFAAVSVNVIKAFRLYIILFGNTFVFGEFLHVFTKASILNLILPYKIGELFRGYYLGKLIHSYPNGYIMAVLDRFVDTLGIISVFIFSNMMLDKKPGSIFVALTVFLAAVMIIYGLFRPLYNYWNHFLVVRKNSANTIWALSVLECCNSAFRSAEGIIRGRFGILYILSLTAWLIEAGRIYLTQKESMAAERYLSDILRGRTNDEYFFFLIFSVLFLGMVQAWEFIRKRREK